MCMHMYVQVPSEARRRCKIPQSWSHTQVIMSFPEWMLGTERLHNISPLSWPLSSLFPVRCLNLIFVVVGIDPRGLGLSRHVIIHGAVSLALAPLVLWLWLCNLNVEKLFSPWRASSSHQEDRLLSWCTWGSRNFSLCSEHLGCAVLLALVPFPALLLIQEHGPSRLTAKGQKIHRPCCVDSEFQFWCPPPVRMF